MEILSYYWPCTRGTLQSLVVSPLKGPVIWSFSILALQTVEVSVIWDTMMLIWRDCNEVFVSFQIADLQQEHQREMEGLLENVRQLSRELHLHMMIIDSFIPPEYQVWG